MFFQTQSFFKLLGEVSLSELPLLQWVESNAASGVYTGSSDTNRRSRRRVCTACPYSSFSCGLAYVFIFSVLFCDIHRFLESGVDDVQDFGTSPLVSEGVLKCK